jgi:hypothetical protein
VLERASAGHVSMGLTVTMSEGVGARADSMASRDSQDGFPAKSGRLVVTRGSGEVRNARYDQA